MSMLNLAHFLLNTFFEKNAILSYKLCFTQIRFFRVMLSIRHMIKHIHKICLLLASTRECLSKRDTLKVLTKIQVSKSILQFATNCVSICMPST